MWDNVVMNASKRCIMFKILMERLRGILAYLAVLPTVCNTEVL